MGHKKHKKDKKTEEEVEDPSVSNPEKRKKKKSKKLTTDSEVLEVSVTIDDGASEMSLSKKSKKKSKKKSREQPTEDAGDLCKENDIKISKKKRKLMDENVESSQPDVSDGESPKKKKKKKSKKGAIDDELAAPDASQEKSKKKKHKRDEDENVQINNEEVKADTTAPVKKKLKSKKKMEKDLDETEETVSQEVTENGYECTEKVKKKKKKRKSLDEVEPADIVKQELDHSTEEQAPKKKKKKKSKNKELSEDTEDQVGNSSSKVEPEGSVTKPNNSFNGTSTLGQWGTATFDSDARQQKFMRLLGGLKKDGNSNSPTGNKLFGSTKSKGKGLFGSLSATTAARPAAQHANYALNAQQQNELESNLTKQYERALAFKFNPVKGIGLGYEAPPDEGKKFYIDTKASKSMKFDD